MKKIVAFFIGIILFCGIFCLESEAAKKSKKGSLPEEEITQMSESIDALTKKMYARGLFSPQDNSDLINVKIKLDNQMLIAPDLSLAPLYYKAAVLYKARDMKQDAIECFQTILENFSDTALAPKAAAHLKEMGVAVNFVPKTTGEGEGSNE